MVAQVSRRGFLSGSAAAVLTSASGASVLASCSNDAQADQERRQRVAFEGANQSGITTPAPQHAIVVSFTCVAHDAVELQAMFRTLTIQTRDLMAGVTSSDLDPLLPPNDNLIVGVHPPADDLTITVGVGASLFDVRYGLAERRPKQLVAMPTFPNDKPDPSRLHGDIVIQICAGSQEMCNRVLRRLMRATRDSLVLKWMMPGFTQPNLLGTGRASQRNLLGFKDGTSNPDHNRADLMDELVWVAAGDDEPSWTAGGTYAAVRLIRNRVEFWDRTPFRTQETVIGRDKANGAPLGMANETDIPDFAADPSGVQFRLDGHIRRANPRTAEMGKNRILRRGYNYSAGFDAAGQLDQGLLFVCFQRTLEDGFLAIQSRLDGEALEEYITPFGGGLYFVLPGVAASTDSFADALFIQQ